MNKRVAFIRRTVTGNRLPRRIRNLLIMLGTRRFLRFLREVAFYVRAYWARSVTTRLRLVQNKRLQNRHLEIGAGGNKVTGFETLNIQWGRYIDYVLDASKPLPFRDSTFEIVYASHILEHIPWYTVEDTLKEWTRIVKPGGCLEVWVPDGLKICKVVVEAEAALCETIPDDWCVKNPDRNPYLWAVGRLFWGANPNYPSWHRSMFTERYLRVLFEKVGLKNVRKLSNTEVRGYDHGWINLGMVGTK